MTRRTALVLVLVAVVSAGIYLAGVTLFPGVDRRAVGFGVVLGGAFQALLLMVASTVFADRRMVAYGVGLVGRMMLLVLAALVLVPLSGYTAAPALFSLVSVLFATTLLEPVAHAPGATNES